MSKKRIGAIIFEGGQPASLPEEQLVRVRRGITLDTIVKLRRIAEIDAVYLATNYPELALAAEALGAQIVPEEEPFHFGRLLKRIIMDEDLDGVIYVGGASCPFLTEDEFRQMAQDLRRLERVVLTNNPQSADIAAFTPAKAIALIEPPENDNVLPTRLRQEAELTRIFLPHSVGVHFDIDTPSDVLVMSLSPRLEPYTREAIEALDWDNSRVKAAAACLAKHGKTVFMAGRINPWTLQHMGMYLRARFRVISEERGMRALGLDERGEVHSHMAFLMEQLGPEGLMEYLAKISQAAFIDSRLIFAHHHLRLTEGQRFASDLGLMELINEPLVEQLTEAAFKAPIPVILGGHSLVAGGMWSLVDTIRGVLGQ